MKDISEHTKDINLKLRIRRILWAQGYYCPLEVDLSHFDYIEDSLRRTSLTDIDVLGIRFESDLRMTTIIADCKSGRESEANRVFWLKGVMDFFNAKEGIFVKKVIRSPSRAIAPKLGIRVLDEKGLDIIEKSLEIDTVLPESKELEIYNKAMFLWISDVKRDQKPDEKQLALKNVYQYLQYQYWVIDEYRNIQTLIERFNRIKNRLDPNNERELYLVFIGLQRLTLSIMKMASSVALLNLNDIKNESHIYLFGGTFSYNERKRFISLLNALSEHYKIGEEMNLEPPYFDELVEIINRVILSSPHAIRMLQYLDVITTEHVLGFPHDLEKFTKTHYSTDTLVLVKRIATLFQKNAGFEEKFFEKLRFL